MNPFLLTLLLVLFFAIADRAVGGGWPSYKGPRRPIAYLGAPLIGVLLLSWPGLCYGIAWVIVRSPPWKAVPGASATPDEPREYLATAARHGVVPLLAAFLIAMGFDLDMPSQILPMLAYTLAATGLAAWYGDCVAKAVAAGEPIGKQNRIVELVRGGAYGAALAATSILLR